MPSREFILSEIQRVYEKNNRAPGMVVFERETGIRKPEWYGAHWRSWSAALVDAGFEPNEKQGKLSSDHILRQYAEFIRHLGRVPAEVDVRMHARDNESFPAHTTFSKHFGNKAPLLRALSAWVVEHEEFVDIANLLPDLEDKITEQEVDNFINYPSHVCIYAFVHIYIYIYIYIHIFVRVCVFVIHYIT